MPPCLPSGWLIIYVTNICILKFTTGHTQSLPHPLPVSLHKTNKTSWNIQLLRPFAFEVADRQCGRVFFKTSGRAGGEGWDSAESMV